MNRSKRNVYTLLFARFFSTLASGIQSFALPLFLIDISGSGLILGTYSLVISFPFTVSTPLSGILGDRYNRKTIIVLSDFTRALLTLSLLLFTRTENLSLICLFLIQSLASLCDSLSNPSCYAILPDLIPQKILAKGNALKSGFENVSMIIAPLVGGLIYGARGIKPILLFSCVLFLTSLFFYRLVSYEKSGPAEPHPGIHDFREEFKEVIYLLKQNPGLKQLLLCTSFLNLLSTPFFAISIPFLLKQFMGLTSQRIGTFQTCSILGMLFGNIIFVTTVSNFNVSKIIKGSAFLQSSFMVILAIATYPVIVKLLGGNSLIYASVLAVLLFAIGIFSSFINTHLSTNIQKTVDSRMLSRFTSVTTLLQTISCSIGSLICGYLLDTISPYHVLLWQSSILFIVMIFFAILASPAVFHPPVKDEQKVHFTKPNLRP